MYILPIVGIIGQNFKYSDLLMHLNAAKNETEIKLVIDSPGGFVDEALKIGETLDATKKVKQATNSGDIASAAVSIFLKAPKEGRTFDPSKGVFLIHMPAVDPKNLPQDKNYTADDLIEMSEGLKSISKDMVKSYANATGCDPVVLQGFINEQKPLTPEQIQSLGFATVVKNELKAVAYYNLNQMDNKEVIEKINGFEALLNKAIAFFKPAVKNLMIQDVNGKELDFGDKIQAPEQIAIGAEATVDGVPAEGEFVMPDGSTMIFAAGKLTEIKPAEVNENEQLKTENAKLKAELEASKAEQSKTQTELENYKKESESKISGIQNEFKAFKNQFTKENFNPDLPDSGVQDKIRKPFKNK